MNNIFITGMFRHCALLLISVFGMLSCNYEYGFIKPGEKEYIYVYDTAVQTVEVEVEVPVEVEVEVEVPVEVPVYIETVVEGEPGEIWIDSFTQPSSVEGVDILWIIDTSGSMWRYEPQLLLGIEAMITALPVSDWRLVMFSNDPSPAVSEAQFPLIPGDGITEATTMFHAMGTGGREQGFQAAYDYITSNPYAVTWMRHDAALLIVFVSDEEEQSGYPMASVTDFTNWYSAQRGGNVFLASIVTQDPTVSLCDWTVSTLDVGDRYMEATNHFGGVVIDICDTDWAPGVTDATHSISPYELWPLTHEPVVDSIVVFIDGALSDGTDWIYSATDNTVYFTTIPGSGSLVEIGYRYLPTADTGGADTATP